MAPQSETQKIDGIVVEALPNTQFRVKLPDDKVIIAHLAGRMRLNRIRVMPGDRVTIELTPYDDSKGRIVYRNK